MTDTGELVVIYIGNFPNAGHLKSVLEAAGIQAFLQDEAMTLVVGSTKVCVAKRDLVRAKSIVEQFVADRSNAGELSTAENTIIPTNKRYFLILSIVALLMAGLWQWPQLHRGLAARRIRAEFQRECPRPKWWSWEKTPPKKVKTFGELAKLIASSQHSRSELNAGQLWKIAYQAIVDYPLDAGLVVLSVNSMWIPGPTYQTVRLYPNMVHLQQFALDRYFSYRNPIPGPEWKSSDLIAEIVLHLVELDNDAGRYDESLTWIRRLLPEREAEINDHLLEHLSLQYSKALRARGESLEAQQVLKRAIESYHGDWEEPLKQELATYESK